MNGGNILTKGLVLTTSSADLVETPASKKSRPRIIAIHLCNVTGSAASVDIDLVLVGTGAGTFSIAKGLSVPANDRIQLDNNGYPMLALAFAGAGYDKITALTDTDNAIHCVVTYDAGDMAPST